MERISIFPRRFRRWWISMGKLDAGAEKAVRHFCQIRDQPSNLQGAWLGIGKGV